MKSIILAGFFFSVTFAQAQLRTGATVPDLKAHDAEGKVFSLKERLSGGYSVVVFGCLT